MILYGNTIQFKSSELFYEKEKRGIKNNTIRTLDNKERMQLLNFLPALRHIKITTLDLSEDFTREIQDVSFFEINKPSCGYVFMVIFTWSTE